MSETSDDVSGGNGEAVGGGSYEARSGDCIASVAFEHGFFWQTLWDHPDNAELKRLRKDPNVLLEGDKVAIPELRVKKAPAATEQRHKFKLKGVPAKLRLRFLQPKEEPPKEEPEGGGEGDESTYQDAPEEQKAAEMEPMANVPYDLDIDGDVTSGQTDGDGKVEISIPPHARKGKLTLKPPGHVERIIPLDLGGMDPVATITGARKRLNNIGYRCAPEGDRMTSDLKEELQRFQYENKLNVSGELDEPTQNKLKELHGC